MNPSPLFYFKAILSLKIVESASKPPIPPNVTECIPKIVIKISIRKSVCSDLLDDLFMVFSIRLWRKSHSPNATIQCNWLENDLKYTEITGA